MKKPLIYLASQSPRRRELLDQVNVCYEVLLLKDDPRSLDEVDETPLDDEPAADYVRRVCKAKADAAWNSAMYQNLPVLPVLAADTTVVLDGRIIGKPEQREDAATILRLLSGRTHRVMTAIAMRMEERIEVRLSDTAVTFCPLSEAQIQRYVATGEADDKAGAYGIQGRAGVFVQRIEGSYSGVVGLPLFETAELLQLFGYNFP